MDRRQIWPLFRRVWITVALGATAIFVVWSLIAYRASPAAKRAWADTAGVEFRSAGDGIWHMASSVARDSALEFVFFPGALVDPKAYAPLLRSVALAGYPVTLVELPRRGAFGGAESTELYDRINTVLARRDHGVVVAGHSRGGVVASQVAADRPQDLAGLILIGTSHPRDVDLSNLTIPVTKIVGTHDGLASRNEVEANSALLPEHTRWIWVEGGNHSQFGWYGFQPMDRRPRIAAAVQRQIMLDAVMAVLAQRR